MFLGLFGDFDSGHFENRSFILYRLNVNGLILTRDRSLNNMIGLPLNESPGDILNHKS